jgi:hypothetical protein
MNTNPKINELISTLLDGESANPRADAAVIAQDLLLEKRQMEYRKIGNMMRNLPEPEVPDHFLDDVLARLPKKKPHNIVRITFSLAAAAVLLLALATTLYRLLPNTPLEPTIPDTPIANSSGISLIEFDVPETTLASIQIENIADSDIEKTLALFEVIPEEILLIALAELSSEEEARYYATAQGTEPLSPWDENLFAAPDSLVDIYTEMETLNEAEAAAFNELMRDALAAT